MAKTLIFLMLLLSLIAQAESVDMRPYIPKGKYIDPDRGCQVEVSYENEKIKIGFSVTGNPTYMGSASQDYVLGGTSWIELDAKSGRIINGDFHCWKNERVNSNTTIQDERFVFASTCSSEHTQTEKVQIQASHGQLSGLLFQREIFRLRPNDAGLIYEGIEEMHFGCKLTPEIKIGAK